MGIKKDNLSMSSMDTSSIETAILAVSSILDCKVVAKKTLSGEIELVAYVVPAGPFSVELLRDKINSVIPEDSIQKLIIPLSSTPLTTQGEWDMEFLEKIHVIDDDLIYDAERKIKAMPGVELAVAVIRYGP